MAAGRRIWPALVLAAYVLLVLLPSLAPFAALFTAEEAGRGRIWDAAVHGPLLGNSVRLAATVAVVAVMLAAALALLLERVRLPLRSALLGALLVPLLVPPYILGTGVLRLLGPRLAIGFCGAAVTLVWWLLPLALLFATAGLRLVTRAHEEAVLLDGRWPQVLWRVTLPMALPHILAGSLFVFALALVEFGVPALFQFRVYSGAIFAEFAAFYDFRRAALTSLPFVALGVLVAGLAQVLIRSEDREGTAEEPFRFNPGRARPYLMLLLGLLTLVALSPLIRLTSEVGSLATLGEALVQVWTQALHTFITAGTGALGAVFLALLAAWVATRLLPGIGRGLLAMQLLLFVLPGVLVGVGVIQLWNAAGWRGAVYTSPLILALGYIARFTPLLVPLVAASYRQLPLELDQAAQLDGAGVGKILGKIHVPLLRPALGVAGLLAFVLCVGEVPVSMLVAPPGEAPLAVRFFTLITNAPAEQVAALSVITTLLALLPVTAWLTLREGPKQ